MGPKQVLPLRIRVELGVMAMKGVLRVYQNSKIGASLSDNLMSLSVGGVLSLRRDVVPTDWISKVLGKL